MRKAKKIAAVLFWLTLALAAVYIVRNIIAAIGTFTSFPWWSAFAFAAIYFGPALVVEAVIYFVFCYCEKRKGEQNG